MGVDDAPGRERVAAAGALGLGAASGAPRRSSDRPSRRRREPAAPPRSSRRRSAHRGESPSRRRQFWARRSQRAGLPELARVGSGRAHREDEERGQVDLPVDRAIAVPARAQLGDQVACRRSGASRPRRPSSARIVRSRSPGDRSRPTCCAQVGRPGSRRPRARRAGCDRRPRGRASPSRSSPGSTGRSRVAPKPPSAFCERQPGAGVRDRAGLLRLRLGRGRPGER